MAIEHLQKLQECFSCLEMIQRMYDQKKTSITGKTKKKFVDQAFYGSAAQLRGALREVFDEREREAFKQQADKAFHADTYGFVFDKDLLVQLMNGTSAAQTLMEEMHIQEIGILGGTETITINQVRATIEKSKKVLMNLSAAEGLRMPRKKE